MFNPLRPIKPIQCSTTHLTSSPEYLRQFYLSGFSTDNFAYILPSFYLLKWYIFSRKLSFLHRTIIVTVVVIFEDQKSKLLLSC